MDRTEFIVMALGAFLWGFTYYYIRRGLNPEVKDITKYRQDAIYGSIANLISKLIMFYLKSPVVAWFT